MSDVQIAGALMEQERAVGFGHAGWHAHARAGRLQCRRRGALVAAVLVAAGIAPARAVAVTAPVVTVLNEPSAGRTSLALGGEVFHTTGGRVDGLQTIAVSPGGPVVVLWNESESGGVPQPYYAISLDGREVQRVRQTSYALKLRYATFDPLAGVPTVPAALAAGAEPGLYLVQFVTQPLEAYRQQIRALGGEVHHFVANHAHLVRMSEAVRQEVERLPFVRWVGPFEPAYRVEEALVEWLASDGPAEALHLNVMVLERGLAAKQAVAQAIVALGGVVEKMTPHGFLLEATLTPAQARALLDRADVLFIDRWFPPSDDMDIAREIGGANYIETLAGFTGAGVRAEVMDGNLDPNHPDFQHDPPIFHGPHSGSTGHGTATYGINFGDGTNNAFARGMVPEAQGIFADYGYLTDRYQHTAELLLPPYEAVYQSNSWGSGWTIQYTSVSAEMDDILFIYDILVCQSQSNTGNRQSRPQAWAKNIVSVGGVYHRNTPDRSDDGWFGGASIGPAADGRIKPDLTHFYDWVLTTQPGGGYTAQFGGTSAATPIVAGHFGLFFQMWSEGVFGNPVTGGTVFENRPHMSTAKAAIINSAYQYPFSGTSHDMTRVHQGWGMPDLKRLYDMRGRMLIIDEAHVVSNLDVRTYSVEVEPQTDELRATLVYTDPAGIPNSSQHRVNDLTLKVTSPGGVVYWGNNGLLEGNWSVPGGGPNTIDTVENVFVPDPEPGTWTVEVFADEINQDSHTETEQIDADYALVVSGIRGGIPGDFDGDGDVDIADFAFFTACFSGSGVPCSGDCCAADLDGDGDVDIADFAVFSANFTGSQ